MNTISKRLKVIAAKLEQNKRREDHQYSVFMKDDGGSRETRAFTIPAGTVEKQDALAQRLAVKIAKEWAHEGVWGEDDVVVTVYFILSDVDGEWEEKSVDVPIKGE